MFFFFSKTLQFLTAPLTVICVLFSLAIFLRSARWRYILGRVALGLLFFCSNDFITNELMRKWEIPATPLVEMKKHYTWGIILTGVTRSDMVLKDRIYFQRGADRVTHAVQLYKTGVIAKLLVSGGSGNLINTGQREADEIASALELMGVKPEDIVTENKSRNTHESAIEVKSMLTGKSKPDECLLITSAFHMRRSAACYAKVGWKMDEFSTDFFSHPRKFSIDVLLIPRMESLGNIHVLVREWVGYIAYTLAGYV